MFEIYHILEIINYNINNGSVNEIDFKSNCEHHSFSVITFSKWKFLGCHGIEFGSPIAGAMGPLNPPDHVDKK